MEPVSISLNCSSLPPAPWAMSWLLLAPYHRRRTISQFAWIQECGEKPTFHLQSQWSPETHLLPVHSPFAVRNLMTECTSHLAGLWIGAAISNTSHSKPLSNEHGSHVKDQGRWKCCHNKRRKFPYQPIHDVSLLSRHTSYILYAGHYSKYSRIPV